MYTGSAGRRCLSARLRGEKHAYHFLEDYKERSTWRQRDCRLWWMHLTVHKDAFMAQALSILRQRAMIFSMSFRLSGQRVNPAEEAAHGRARRRRHSGCTISTDSLRILTSVIFMREYTDKSKGNEIQKPTLAELNDIFADMNKKKYSTAAHQLQCVRIQHLYRYGSSNLQWLQ